MALADSPGLRWLAPERTLDLLTRLTLLLIVFSDWVAGDAWQFQAPLRLLALGGLALSPLHRNPWLWFGVSLCMTWKSVLDFGVQDNHVFLINYWMVGLFLGLCSDDPLRAVARTSRLLVGLAFLFAVLWKAILSPDFNNGDYFHFTFLVDTRFYRFVTVFAGMQEQVLRDNLSQLQALLDANGETLQVTLQDTPRLALLAKLTTWWVNGIEIAIAALFLLPTRLRITRWRHAALIVFALSTYFSVPLDTFGWMLMALGLAQCEPGMTKTRIAYVASCLVIKTYKLVPILELLSPGQS